MGEIKIKHEDTRSLKNSIPNSPVKSEAGVLIKYVCLLFNP